MNSQLVNTETGICMDGEIFLVKMAALIFLRGLRRYDSIQIAHNLASAGIFRHIVVRFEDSSGKVGTKFIQLKLRQGKSNIVSREKLFSLSGDFSIFKYYLSYREIEKQFPVSDSKFPKSGLFEDCWFIMLTDASLKQTKDVEIERNDSLKSTWADSRQISLDNDVFELFSDWEICLKLFSELVPLMRNIYKYENEIICKIDRFQHKITNKELQREISKLKVSMDRDIILDYFNVFQNIGDSTTYHNFLLKLKMFTDLGGESNLDRSIKREIQKFCKTSIYESEMIYQDIFKNMVNWWHSANVTCLSNRLNSIECIFKKVQDRINTINQSKVKEMLCLSLEFNNNLLSKLKKVLVSDYFINIVVEEGPTILSCIRVQQTLKNIENTNSLFVSLQHLRDNIDEVRGVWPSGLCKILVVDCEEEIISANELSEFLHDDYGKMLLITKQHLGDGFVEIIDACTLEDLTEKSQEFALKTIVNFQGDSLSLGSLISHHSAEMSIVKANMLYKIFTNARNISFGHPMTSNIEYYIPRNLERLSIVLRKDVFEDEGIFVVSGVDKNYLQELIGLNNPVGYFYNNNHQNISSECKHIALREIENEKAFNDICEELGKGNIHLLRLEHDVLTWRASNGDASRLMRYVNTGSTGYSDNLEEFMEKCNTIAPQTNTVWDIPDRVVLISGEPGIGKSYLVTQLALQSKKARPETWIVRANFCHFKSYLNTLNISKLGKLEGYRFLLKASQVNVSDCHSIEYELLKHSKKIVVLLDGFDEISSEQVNKAIILMRGIRNLGVEKLWVTSRPMMRKRLVRGLSIVSFTINPFSKEQEETFLINCFKNRVPKVSSETLKEFISKLFVLPNIAENSHNVCVDGVPLHSIMFSEAFEERLTTFQNTGNVDIPDKIDLIELLIKLVRKHRDIYYEKYNFEVNNYDISENADIYVGYHVRSALQAILPPGHISQLHDRTIEERNMSFIKRLQGGETTTFIEGIIDGRPQFSHRVYAEFFASLWFVKYFRQNRDFIEQKFHTWEYREIRFMFDRELVSGHEIHEAILKGDIASVRTHLFRKANVNATDLGGRTPLHVLASLPPSIITSGEPSAVFEELTLTLLRAGADVKLTDHVLGKDPFYYIYKNSVWIMYVVWLRRMLSHEDPAYKQLLQVYKADYPLYLAAINGYLELVTVALEMDLPPNTVVIDTNQSTILHGAAFTGNLKIVDLLIKHGADLNVRDAEGMSALMLAAGEDHLDVVRSLTDHRADLDLQNNTGNCALHLAAEQGHLRVVKCLVRAGCTINVINNKGETPLDCAKSVVRDSRVGNKDYTNRLKSVVRYLADATCMYVCSLQ